VCWSVVKVDECLSVLQYQVWGLSLSVAVCYVCCSVLQCVAVCCSVLQCQVWDLSLRVPTNETEVSFRNFTPNHRRRKSDLKQLRLPKFPTSFHGCPRTYQSRFLGSPKNFKQGFTWVNGVPVMQKSGRDNCRIWGSKYFKSDILREWCNGAWDLQWDKSHSWISFSRSLYWSFSAKEPYISSLMSSASGAMGLGTCNGISVSFVDLVL